MQKAMVIVWTLTVVLLIATVASAETVVLMEDFEDAGAVGEPPEDWEALMDMDATVALADVSSLDAPEGSLAARLEDESYNMSAQLRRELGQAVPKGWIEYLVYISPEKPAEAYVELRADNVGKVLDCHLSSGGNFKCRSDGSLRTLMEDAELGVWHKVRIEWNTETWTYRAYLGGVDYTPESGLNFNEQGVPSEINFKVGSNSKVGQMAYVDALRVVSE